MSQCRATVEILPIDVPDTGDLTHNCISLNITSTIVINERNDPRLLHVAEAFSVSLEGPFCPRSCARDQV